MIVIILLCFLAPANGQQSHAATAGSYEIKAQKHFLVADVEDDNEDEDENESCIRRLNLPAGSTAFTRDAFVSNPNHYKNSQVLLSNLSTRYIFHGVLRI